MPRMIRRRFLQGLLSLSVIVTTRCGGGSAAHLTGTNLGKERAPDFRLRDSTGQSYSLDQFRGKVVILTFLYTHCPDYCPLTAELLRHADEAAGHPADVVYLAVSVDPLGDTPASIATFEQEHRLGELGDRWHYLIGNPPELQSVWRSYYIGVSGDPGSNAADHTSAIYFIDKQGDRRLLTQLDVRAEDIARNALVLAKS